MRRETLRSLGLLGPGADVNRRDRAGMTPLMRAVVSGSVPLVRAVLALGPDVRARDKEERTALIYVDTTRPKGLAVARLLVRYGADMDAHDLAGMTLLLSACIERNMALVRLLIRKGAALDIPFGTATPMLWALEAGQSREIALELIEAGADVNVAFEDGRTALYYATDDDQALLKALLARGIRLNVTDAYGTTPLMHAAMYSPVEAIRLLLEAGADPRARDEDGRTALDWAAERYDGHSEEVSALLRAADKSGP